jgi:hypothetical protein
MWCDDPTEGQCDFRKGGMFKELTVRQFLFEGYTDPFFSWMTYKEVRALLSFAPFSLYFPASCPTSVPAPIPNSPISKQKESVSPQQCLSLCLLLISAYS